MMRGFRALAVTSVQRCLLTCSYLLHKPATWRHKRDVSWVVGPYELAGLVHAIAGVVPGSFSIVLAHDRYYVYDYGSCPRRRLGGKASAIRAGLLGPWRLGMLACRAKGFIYIGQAGYLLSSRDGRDFEFRWLKKRGLKLVCYFTGNDIRSPEKMRELEKSTGRPNLGTYLGEVNPVFRTLEYERLKRQIAGVADRYADELFNADVDQRGYLTRPCHPFLYFHDDSDVIRSFAKFRNPKRPIVIHAPSAPILKGTPLVRAAVESLRESGHDFEYVELTGVSNARVKEELARAHIALNEFYSTLPGVFGVEAMASGCALITSADENHDPQLPRGSNKAWFVTPHTRLTEHLKILLDDWQRTERFAHSGARWVVMHATTSRSGEILNRVLDAIN